MSYFQLNTNITLGQELELTGPSFQHIVLARRCKVGNKLELQGVDAKRFMVEVIAINKKSLTVKILELIPVPAESKLELTVVQAMVAEQVLDLVLQKAVELGVKQIILFRAEHSASHIKNVKAKQLRWQNILQSAAEQCGRTSVPVLLVSSDLRSALKQVGSNPVFAFHITGSSLKKLIPKNINFFALAVGPEGGWSDSELALLGSSNNVVMATLGPRTMRAETASIVASGILQYLYGDLG